VAIVDLDKGQSRRGHPIDRGLPVVLVGACALFAVAVWISVPRSAPARSASLASSAPAAFAAIVPRGAILHPLTLPQKIDGVDLGAMPDRLANEAAPAAWQRVISVRGIAGVASVSGPAVIAWTEAGIAYWLTSPTKTIDELIQIASDLR
jgi:hypothetical protein